MKFKGTILIEFWNEKLSEKTREDLIIKNLIFNETYKKIADGNFQLFSQNLESTETVIALLGNTEPVTVGEFEDISIVWDVIKYGVWLYPSPIWFENVTPYFGLITNRVDADNTAYTFDSVGLICSTDVNFRLSRVLLSVPCTVAPFTILRIFYEIALDITDSEILTRPYTERFFRDYGKSLFGVSSLSSLNLSPRFFPFFSPSNIQNGTENNLTGYQKYLAFWNNTTGYKISDIRGNDRFAYAVDRDKYKYFGTAFSNILQSGIPGTQDEDVGVIFNSIVIGSSPALSSQPNFIPSPLPLKSNVGEIGYYSIAYNSNERNIDNTPLLFKIPFQNSWLHKASSGVPYFDESTFGESTGIYQAQIKSPATKTSNPFPVFIKIEIITTGDNSSATYRFAKVGHLGTVGNTYTSRNFTSPFLCSTTQPFDKCHGWQPDHAINRLYIGGSSVLMWDDSGCTVLDLMTGVYRNFDATTTPVLTATDIKQCAWNNSNLVFIGCRDTGLWKLNLNDWTLAQVVTGNCYGVSTGFNNIIYAALGSGIRDSADGFVANNSTIASSAVGGNFANIKYIHARKSAAGLAIIYDNAGDLRLVWTNLIATPSVEITNLASYYASDEFNTVGNATNDFWVVGYHKATFNSIVLSALPESFGGIVEFWDNYFIANDNFVDINLFSISKAQVPSGTSQPLIHLADGICLFNGVNLFQVRNDSLLYWEEYEWNGSAWVKGSTTAKTMHSTYQDLIYDIEIQFTTNTPAAYLATEHFIQPVNYGILKDNSTTLDFKYAFYSIDTRLATQTGTVAAIINLANSTSPGFVSIDSDGIIATIDGVAASTVYTNGEIPLANEISVNLTNGDVAFFAGDTGKTYTIEYIAIGFFL